MGSPKRPLAFLLLIVVLGAAAGPGGWIRGLALFRQDAPLDEPAYWEFVHRSREQVGALQGRPQAEIEAELAQLAQEWQAVREVRTADGEVIPLEPDTLLVRLQADPPSLDEIERSLDALLAAHENHPLALHSRADLASLEEVLARPEFDWPEARPSPLNAWIQRLLERLDRWLNSLFGDGPIEIPFDLKLLPVLAAILLAVILGIVFRSLFSEFIREARAGGDGQDGETPLTAQAAYEKAQALSRGGDFRTAVRYLYLSSLLALDERGLLRYDRTKTNREYLRSVSQAPELAGPLGEVVEVFDDVWYGYHALEEESFRRYSERVRDLKEGRG